jgi:hypothetical protein
MALPTDVKVASEHEAPSERRGSIVVDGALASEEDAAVLAKMGCVHSSIAILVSSPYLMTTN